MENMLFFKIKDLKAQEFNSDLYTDWGNFLISHKNFEFTLHLFPPEMYRKGLSFWQREETQIKTEYAFPYFTF